MSFSHVVDIERLIAPISEDTPQGSDIREDRSPTSDFYTIKDARNAARAAERSAVFGEDDAVDLIGPWETVSSVAQRVLSDTSKDLEVAAWYLESLIRLQGLSGLRDGLFIIERLVTDFWDGLYPMPDEDGIETRVAPMTGLNGDGGDGTLLAPLRNLEITNYGDKGAFTYWQFLQARDADRIEDEDKKAERVASLGYSLEDFTATINSTDTLTCQNFVSTLEECVESYKKTSAALREKCGGEAPPSTKISELLEEILRTTRFAYKERLEAAEAAAAAEAEAEAPQEVEMEQGSSDAPATGRVVHLVSGSQGPITSREEALKRLEEVAKYFRQYEPHTPIAPGLERLIGWGRMTVAELMMELIPDANARSLFTQYTGVKMDGSDNATYVAPPTVAPAATQTTPESPAPAAAPEPEKESSGGLGW